MSRTQYYCAATLDGYIAEADDSLSWLLEYQGSYRGENVEPMKGSYDRFYDGVGALVMGSVTYEWILDHMGMDGEWPYRGKPSWVLSSRELQRPAGEGVDIRVVRAEVDEIYDDMIGSAGAKHLWVVGGGNVASQFADNGLLDELLVTVVPVVLGRGKPLFDRRVADGPMQLLGARVFDSGMVELHYEIKRGDQPPRPAR